MKFECSAQHGAKWVSDVIDSVSPSSAAEIFAAEKRLALGSPSQIMVTVRSHGIATEVFNVRYVLRVTTVVEPLQ